MQISEQTPWSSESSCQTVLHPHQQALLSYSEENMKPQHEKDLQLTGLQERCNGIDCANQAHWVISLPSPAKGSHYWGHYTQQRQHKRWAGIPQSCSTAPVSPHIALKSCDSHSVWDVDADRSLCLHGIQSTASLCCPGLSLHTSNAL